jgi:phosphocarrier protein HPr
MTEKKVIVVHEHGIHMRPAMMFVDVASQFDCDMTITKGDKSADATSIMQVTMIAVTEGAEVTISAEGKDEQEAVNALVGLIENDFKLETTSKK